MDSQFSSVSILINYLIVAFVLNNQFYWAYWAKNLAVDFN